MNAQALREVRRDVAEAADAQVLQVVRMVDSLAERGETDEVLAPVRPRLRAIQPPRPLRFARLLFMPMDPLIVVPSAWRPGTPFLPRNAVMVLARAARLAMQGAGGPDSVLARVDALTREATTAQMGVVRRAGALLWPEAAGVLRGLAAQPPPDALAADWAAESLPPAELVPLMSSLAGILGGAPALHDHDHSGVALRDDAAAGLLAACEPLGPRAWGMMLSLLVIRVPQASAALLAAAQKKGSQRGLAEAAAETALTWLETETGAQVAAIPPGAPADLNRQASLLETLSDQLADAAQRRRLAQTRANLLAGSLDRFEAALQSRVAAPLQALPDGAGDREAALDTMEGSARTLRAFELEARRLGGGPKFDAMVAAIQQTMETARALSAMDRARLTEILAGPEAAMRLLGG